MTSFTKILRWGWRVGRKPWSIISPCSAELAQQSLSTGAHQKRQNVSCIVLLGTQSSLLKSSAVLQTVHQETCLEGVSWCDFRSQSPALSVRGISHAWGRAPEQTQKAAERLDLGDCWASSWKPLTLPILGKTWIPVCGVCKKYILTKTYPTPN